MYERYASFNRYGDLSKFITDPDLLQVIGDSASIFLMLMIMILQWT